MAPAAEGVPRRPKRKRVRKSRTAVVSSDDDSSDEAPPNTQSSLHKQPSSPHTTDSEVAPGYATDTSSDFDAEPDDHALDFDVGGSDEIDAPAVDLPHDAKANEARPPRRVVGGRLASMTADEISRELHTKQRAAFHSLWMKALTDEFADELDQIRQVCRVAVRRALTQTDTRLVEDTSSSAATSRLPLLIDSLSFGSEVFPSGRGAQDQVNLALPVADSGALS